MSGDGNENGGESSQSSENPPFFVHGTGQDWLPANDWLRKEAYVFRQKEHQRIAYPQGVFLKRVEQECSKRVGSVNTARIQKALKA